MRGFSVALLCFFVLGQLSCQDPLCVPTPDETCEGKECLPGTMGCPCLGPGRTCAASLVCQSSVCVPKLRPADSGGGPTSAGTGGATGGTTAGTSDGPTTGTTGSSSSGTDTGGGENTTTRG